MSNEENKSDEIKVHVVDDEATDAAFTESPDEAGPDSVGDELSKLQDDLAEAESRALRCHAELENYRKRIHRQMEDERKYAALPLLQDLLPVVDNLHRALASAEQSENAGGLLQGVQLVADQLDGILQKHHCTVIETKGKLFDPHLHEAIAQYPSKDVPQGAIMEVTQVGYQLHDRVVRPSQVLVSGGPPPQQAGAGGTETGEKAEE